jgi:hypothetical protein
MPVGLEGSENTTSCRNPLQKANGKKVFVQRLPEMEYKKLAGLESDRQFSFLEVCHD